MTSPPSLSASALLAAVPHVSVLGSADWIVTGCTCDSREVRPGDLFMALSGFNRDGRAFAEEAFRRGARVVCAHGEPLAPLPPGCTWIVSPRDREAFSQAAASVYKAPGTPPAVLGVTGTNGKTTVAYLLRSILREPGGAGMLGTIEYDDGEGLTPATRTTPEAHHIHRWLRTLALKKIPYAVMEVSSHSLVLHRVDHVPFRVAAFTNLSRDHMDFHRSLEEYYLAKRKLFKLLDRGGKAVVNREDTYGKRLSGELARRRVVEVGFGPEADVYPEEVAMDLSGTRTLLRTPKGRVAVRSRLTGRFNLQNIMVATAAALAAGATPDQVAQGIEALQGVPGRMEQVIAGQPFFVFVDYAHTDDALKNLLLTVKALNPRRILTVFGCGGDRDRSKRPLMGAVSARLSDVVILTSDNPRSEPPEAIMEEVETGIKPELVPEKAYIPLVDRLEAIRKALSLAEEGDVVVVAGKGHEGEQYAGGETHPFHDPTVIKRLLAEMGWPGER